VKIPFLKGLATAAAAWANYLTGWTLGKNLRTVACLIASALLTLSLLLSEGLTHD
jgi:uncharacterized membrane protein